MSTKTAISLYGFKHDLRLNDTPSFNQLCSQVNWLIRVYANGREKEQSSQLCEGNIVKFKLFLSNNWFIMMSQAIRAIGNIWQVLVPNHEDTGVLI